MNLLDPLSSAALATAALLLLSLLAVRRRQRDGPRQAHHDALDTVASWPPEAARILNVTERQAFELLKRALPGFMVLAQVPLSYPCGTVNGATGQLVFSIAGPDASADASGTAAYVEVCTSAGVVKLSLPAQAGAVAVPGKAVLNTLAILAAGTVEVTALTVG